MALAVLVREPVSNDKFRSTSSSVKECWERLDIVATVGITEQDPPRGDAEVLHASPTGLPIPPPGFMQDDRTSALGRLARPIRRSVIDDPDELEALSLKPLHNACNGIGLVEGRDHDFHRVQVQRGQSSTGVEFVHHSRPKS